MKLKRSTETVLRIMAPTWMKRLQEADWNKSKLLPRFKNILDSDAKRCFIGEIHCMTSDYLKDGSDPCGECKILCQDVPDMMKQCKNVHQKKDLLDRIAEHVVELHPDLLIKKTLLRAHLVFKEKN